MFSGRQNLTRRNLYNLQWKTCSESGFGAAEGVEARGGAIEHLKMALGSCRIDAHEHRKEQMLFELVGVIVDVHIWGIGRMLILITLRMLVCYALIPCTTTLALVNMRSCVSHEHLPIPLHQIANTKM